MTKRAAAPKRHDPPVIRTASHAREYLALRASQLTAVDFTKIVLLVTVDSVFWCSAAVYERRDDFDFVWTEHNGHRFVHRDELVKIHVFAPSPVTSA